MRHLPYIFIALAIVLCAAACSQDRNAQSDQLVGRLLDEGMAHLERHDLTAAMLSLKEAEQAITPQTDHQKACRVFQHIGWINASSGDLQLALIYFDYALPHAWATRKESLVIDVLIGKAHVLNELGETEHAFQTNQHAMALSQWADKSQLSTMLKNQAYHQLLHDSIAEAEINATKALELATDTASLGNAFTLLSHIYQQQGDKGKLQQLLSRFNESNNTQVSYSRLRIQYEYFLQQGNYQKALEAYRLMENVSQLMDRSRDQVQLLKVQDQYEREVSEREKAEQKWWYSLAVIVLLNAVFLPAWWYSRKQQRLYRRHQQEMKQLRQQMGEKLHAIAASLPIDHIFSGSIAETKAGIDVLYDIIAGNNISQYGKQQERQATQVLWQVNPTLAKQIDNCPVPLTPKETFFCIMEHYGKSDEQKANSFCCSEQAIRSTKSRLGKKIDISTLRTTQ
ncbi:MAG: ABC transporter ATP-binding protein [Prevotella sp.]|nr:ABC transporter ATP-binding protein [Prevotella sp.]